MFIDTHCHIHEASYPLDRLEVMARARDEGVGWLLCVGTSVESSHEAVDFATEHRDCVRAVIGVHPHDTKDGYAIEPLVDHEVVVAIGEIGLDYYYSHSPKEVQIAALRDQLDIAVRHELPVVLHVRDAFDDFWPIFDEYDGNIRGVLHSFTDTKENLDKALARGLFIGVNGISTFTKDPLQQAMFDAIPLHRLLLETDAPFLTPAPFRGKINEPVFVTTIAKYHAERRGITLKELAQHTTTNARALLRF